MSQIRAPWTVQQVLNLWRFQQGQYVHPFTCLNRQDKHPHILGDVGTLIPTRDGWICPFCDYHQNWAHDFMLDGSMLAHQKKFMDALDKQSKQ